MELVYTGNILQKENFPSPGEKNKIFYTVKSQYFELEESAYLLYYQFVFKKIIKYSDVCTYFKNRRFNYLL